VRAAASRRADRRRVVPRLLRELLLARWFRRDRVDRRVPVAWTVPETASPLLIEGAMALVMIPIFVRATAGGAEPGRGRPDTLPRLAAR
jgi:putative peptidoglycan lipid II flippase